MGFISIKNMYLKERVKFENKEGEDLFSRGPYKLEICKKILSMVLKAQISVRQNGPDPYFSLILPEELYEIRKIWLMERGDWEDSIPKIYREIIGSDLNWSYDDTGIFNRKDHLILKEVCSKHGVQEVLVQKLMEAERQTSGMNKRSSIFQRIGQILLEEWRDEEEVTKEVIEDFSNKNLVSKKVKDKVLKNLEQKKNKRQADIKKKSVNEEEKK
jgi:DNA sulfur modification protein DndC